MIGAILIWWTGKREKLLSRAGSMIEKPYFLSPIITLDALLDGKPPPQMPTLSDLLYRTISVTHRHL